jgi:anti-repressor protein
MNNLIPVNYDGEKQTVSGRELHEFLEVGTHFKDWFPRMCEYGFTEGMDYTPLIFEHPQNKQPTTDYQLTIEMAKEISMLQRTEKGKQARRYFIELEKAWNSPEALMARALKMADVKLLEYKNVVVQLEGKLESQLPKVIFADSVAVSNTSILIGELAKIIKGNGVDIGEKRFFEWLRNNKYLISRKGTDYNAPTQKSMDLGIFKVKETVVTHSDGHITINKTTKCTGKGQIYFVNKFKTELVLA